MGWITRRWRGAQQSRSVAQGDGPAGRGGVVDAPGPGDRRSRVRAEPSAWGPRSGRSGVLLQETSRPAEAEPLLRRALEIYEAGLGSEHPSTRAARESLAGLLAELSALAERGQSR